MPQRAAEAAPPRHGVSAAVAAIAEGLRLLPAPGVRAFVLAPVGLSMLLLIPGIGWLLHRADALATLATEALPHWLGFLHGAIAFATGLVVAVGGAWLIAIVAVWLVAPLLGPLAEHVAFALGGRRASGRHGFVAAIGHGLLREWQKLRHLLPRFLLTIAITVVPGLNVLAPAAWLLFGAWLMAVEFTDFAADNAGLPLAATLAALRGDRLAALAFGAIIGLLLAIPFAAIVVLPLAAASGTALWVRRLSTLADSAAARSSG